MKVRVIGSGSMWSINNSASYLVDDDTLIDCPNGNCKAMYRHGINPENICNVLITHFHGDHFFDMPFYTLLKARSHNKTINIYCSGDGIKKNENLFKMAFPNTFRKIKKVLQISYCHSRAFTINNYSVKKVLVNHGGMKPAHGYIITDGDKSAGFTGDTAICKNVIRMASECNYLFCDCMFEEGTSKHMGIDVLKKLAFKNPNCIFVVSHLNDDTRKILMDLKIKNIIVPKDGMIIEI